MKLRNLFFFGFFIFICIALFLRYNPSFQRPINNLEVPIVQLETDQIESFILSYEEEEAIFSREREQWIVSNGVWSNEVLSEMIDPILGQLSEIRSLGIYGQSDRAWPNVKKGSFNIVDIKTYQKRNLLAHFQLAVGNQMDSLGNPITLLKYAESDVVYQVDSGLKDSFLQPIKRFRNTQILSFNPVIVQEVNLKKRDSILLAFNHLDSVWILKQGFYLENTEMNAWLGILSQLKGADFADRFNELDAYSLLFREIEFLLENQSPIHLRIYSDPKQGTNNFILNSNQYPDRYFKFDSTSIYRDILPTKLLVE